MELEDTRASNEELKAQKVDLYSSLQFSRESLDEKCTKNTELEHELQNEKKQHLVAQNMVTSLQSAQDVMREGDRTLKEQNRRLELLVAKLQADAAQPRLAEERQRLERAMEERVEMLELENDLKHQLARDSERRAAEELRRQALQKEAEQRQLQRSEMYLRVLKRRELRAELRARQERWNSYQSAWHDFDASLHTGSSHHNPIILLTDTLLEYFHNDLNGIAAAAAPCNLTLCTLWPTASGLLHDVNTTNIETFLLSSIPGLADSASTEHHREAVKALEKELLRWRSRELARVLRDPGVVAAAEVVVSVISRLLARARADVERVV
ncbi:hypothetical protein MBLNU459_g7808t2 [Dothideomycetes sp. NU459]